MTSDSQVRAIFDRIAPVYDQLNDWLSLGQHRVWKQMTLKWSEAKAGDVCLDLCCGSGDMALLLGRQVGASGRVYGVDFAPQLLAIAQERCDRVREHPPCHVAPAHDMGGCLRTRSQYPKPDICWVEADALNLPFTDNFFDAATMSYGLRNVMDIPGCLQELHRVLKPGASAAILDFHRPSQPYGRAFQQWYLDNIVVPVAQQLGLREEYAYIAPSLERFPNGLRQVTLARLAGFAIATHYPIASGMMGVLVVTKA
ncbi:MAG: class I SAM-dependent methyltransferase [Hormoscilla sp. GUM202]|nr:class I SAM-dependent methyltransferase [Hormoscilla sp. GUM202]